jgi:tetratricopeptide (TPR) repeat protein
MNDFARWVCRVGLAVSFGLASGSFVPAGDEPGDREKPDVPVQQILERLDKVERELLQLRIKSGKIPADKSEQRILTLIETPYLGSVYTGSPNNQRFLAIKLVIVNLTDEAVALKRDDVQLSADGQLFPIKDPPQQLQYNGFQIGQQQMQMRNLQMASEINAAVGATATTWMVFPELPPGSHVPQLVLKLKFGEKNRDLDINAAQRDALGINVERIGPRGSLGLITLGGALDTINVGTLIEEVDRLTGDKLVRVVIHWKESGSITDPQISNWIHNAAINLGRQQNNETQFPAFPASLRELHLAEVPEVGNSRGIQQVYPAFSFQNPGVGAVGRIHKTEAEAVIAALRTAYESLPRDELLQAVQSGKPLERAAALVGGGGRLASDKLPLLLKLADDNDPVIQQGALLALSHFGEAAAIGKLVDCARKNAPPLSVTAIAGLAGSRFASAHEALLELLRNESPESKKNIVRILATYPRPIWSDAIYEFVKDSRSGLNVEALQALVQVGHPKLVPVLEEALRGPDRTLAQTALNVLIGRTDRESEEIALAYTLDHLRTMPPTPVMLQLLNRVKDKRAVPLLMAQFTKSDNKSALIQTLTLLGDAEVASFLVEKYNTLQSHEKGEILKALARFDKTQFRRLAAQALLTSDGTLINPAIQGLQEEGGPEAIKVMIDTLDASSNSFTWGYLCNALAQAGTPAARAALLKARDSENIEKRNHAIGALQILRQRSPGFQYIVHAQNFAQEKKWKEAIEQFDLAIELDPALSDAYAERGHALLHLDKAALAGKDFDKALDLDPFNSLAVTGACLAIILAEGRHAEAVRKLEDARARFPRNAMFHYNAACVYGRAVERLKKDDSSTTRDKLLEQYQQAALSDLKSSIQNGFQEFGLMKEDPDLAPFQDVPEFQQLLTAPPPAEAAGRAGRGGRGARAVRAR